MLLQSLVTLTSLVRLFINPEFCQCPLRSSCQLQLFWYLQQTKVTTKSKVGSLTMQPAKHDITVMPPYQMYPYPTPVRYGWLYIPLFCLIIQYRKLFWKVLKNFAKYREILPKFWRSNLKIFKRKVGKGRELLRRILRNIS